TATVEPQEAVHDGRTEALAYLRMLQTSDALADRQQATKELLALWLNVNEQTRAWMAEQAHALLGERAARGEAGERSGGPGTEEDTDDEVLPAGLPPAGFDAPDPNNEMWELILFAEHERILQVEDLSDLDEELPEPAAAQFITSIPDIGQLIRNAVA